MTKRDFSFKPTAAAEAGALHRSEAHLGTRHTGRLQEAIKVASRKKPGPTPAFGGAPLKRLNAFLPEDLTRRINAEAVQAGQTVGEYLAAKLYGEASKESDPKQS
jgi:hypothetical protein